MVIKTDRKIRKIAFFGDAETQEKDRHFQDAFEVANLLAKNGYTIVNGGGNGIMLASTLGAKSGGGKVEIVTWSNPDSSIEFEGKSVKNVSLVDKKYSQPTYQDRVKKLIEISDAFIIFRGGSGTISELGMVWCLAKLNYGHHKPVIFYGKFWRKIMKVINKNMNIDEKEKNVYKIVNKKSKVLENLKEIGNKNE